MEEVEARLAAVVEDYESLHELHSEYLDVVVDVDDPDVLEVWREIEHKLRQVPGRIDKLSETGVRSSDEIDELEAMIDDLNESYGELAALL